MLYFSRASLYPRRRSTPLRMRSGPGIYTIRLHPLRISRSTMKNDITTSSRRTFDTSRFSTVRSKNTKGMPRAITLRKSSLLRSLSHTLTIIPSTIHCIIISMFLRSCSALSFDVAMSTLYPCLRKKVCAWLMKVM